MADTDDTEPASQLQAEPQGERGEPGSRDKGAEPGGGPADRAVGTSDPESDKGVNVQGTIQEDMPEMPAG